MRERENERGGGGEMQSETDGGSFYLRETPVCIH